MIRSPFFQARLRQIKFFCRYIIVSCIRASSAWNGDPQFRPLFLPLPLHSILLCLLFVLRQPPYV